MHYGSYLNHSTLKSSDVLTLVRRQRRLEAKIAPLGLVLDPLVAQEKTTRQTLDSRLVAVGFRNLDAISVGSYDVTHYERKGQSSVNTETLLQLLLAGGVDQEFAARCIAQATETADDVRYCSVKPQKGTRAVASPRSIGAIVDAVARVRPKAA